MAQLNGAFLGARNLSQMVVAYHEAAYAMRYFVERTGRTGIATALRRYGEGKDTDAIVRELTGQGVDELDRGFRAWLGEQLRGYDGQLLLRPSDYSDVETLEARVKEAPTDERARALLALAKLGAGHLDDAKQLLDRGGTAPEMLYASARIFLLTKHLDEAEAALKLLRSTSRGADVEILTARIAKARGQIDAAWTALEAAAVADPERAEPLTLEAELAAGTPRPTACPDATACQIKALERAFELEHMDASIGKRLFTLLAAAKSPRAVEIARRTLEVTPFDQALRDAAKKLAQKK
jgi:hypothetical protein